MDYVNKKYLRGNLDIMQKFTVTGQQSFVAENWRVNFSQRLPTLNVPTRDLVSRQLNIWSLQNYTAEIHILV